MESLKDILNRACETSPTFGEPPECVCAKRLPCFACDRCVCGSPLVLGGDGLLRGHRCCDCADAGRVRVTVNIHDPRFGKSELCGSCQGSSTERPVAEAEPEPFHERARIPHIFRGERLDTWVRRGDQRDTVARWVAGWKPSKPFLVLTGGVGVGKSHLAAGALWEAYERHGVRGQWWGMVPLLARYKATFDENAVETESAIDAQMRRMPLLVLDDLGAQKGTEWANEKVFGLVNQRYEDGSPTVITANKGAIDDRTFSRITGARVAVVVSFGDMADYRRVAS